MGDDKLRTGVTFLTTLQWPISRHHSDAKKAGGFNGIPEWDPAAVKLHVLNSLNKSCICYSQV